MSLRKSYLVDCSKMYSTLSALILTNVKLLQCHYIVRGAGHGSKRADHCVEIILMYNDILSTNTVGNARRTVRER